jgi:nitrogen fixation protein NifZ
MITQWREGDAVRLTRNVRNDGTYSGAATGDLLVRRGSVGVVVDIGTFLMDQIIYSVHFLDTGRVVGCREEELQGAEDEWVPSIFETRQRVLAGVPLAANGELLVAAGAIGEVLQVLRSDGQVVYHVHFDCLPGRIFAIPEASLRSLGGRDERVEA